MLTIKMDKYMDLYNIHDAADYVDICEWTDVAVDYDRNVDQKMA